MKTISNSIHRSVLAGIAVLFVFTGAANNLWAHDGDWDTNHHYYRDKHGYWDEHDHYRSFTTYHDHHGYWDNRGSVRVFINVD